VTSRCHGTKPTAAGLGRSLSLFLSLSASPRQPTQNAKAIKSSPHFNQRIVPLRENQPENAPSRPLAAWPARGQTYKAIYQGVLAGVGAGLDGLEGELAGLQPIDTTMPNSMAMAKSFFTG
jgi:hypothetical protein